MFIYDLLGSDIDFGILIMADRSCFKIPQDYELQYVKIVSSQKYYSFFKMLTSIAFTGKMIFAPSFSFYRINFDFQVKAVNYVIITNCCFNCFIWVETFFGGCSIHQYYQRLAVKLIIAIRPSQVDSDP